MLPLEEPKCFRFSTFLAAALITFTGAAVFADMILPFKDELFKNRKPLEILDDGRYVVYPYSERIDLKQRDTRIGKKAKKKYVQLIPQNETRLLDLKVNGTPVDAFELGAGKNSKFSLIYIHGTNYDKHQGMNDWSFGGNYNRLKNLILKSGGTYYAPTLELVPKSADQISAIIDHIERHSPRAKIILVCGSAGSVVCQEISKREQMVSKITAYIFLAAQVSADFVESSAVKNKTPLLFALGTSDEQINVQNVLDFYKNLRTIQKDYPIKLILYKDGKHGTPLRLFDWRTELNRLLK